MIRVNLALNSSSAARRILGSRAGTMATTFVKLSLVTPSAVISFSTEVEVEQAGSSNRQITDEAMAVR